MHKGAGVGSMVFFPVLQPDGEQKGLDYINNQGSKGSKLLKNACNGLGSSDSFRWFPKKHVELYVR